MFLPGESHGQRSPEGYSPGGCKESDSTEQLPLLLEQAGVPREKTDGATGEGEAEGWGRGGSSQRALNGVRTLSAFGG